MSSTKLGRREFIASAMKSFGAIGATSVVAETLMGHLLNKAFAATGNQAYYIHLSLISGPPRWYFDQPLNPTNGGSSVFTPGGFGTMITKNSSGIASVVHTTHLYEANGKKYYLPPVWGMPRSGTRSSDLLQHMQMFRGVDMQINNHPISNQRQVAPVIGGLSIGGSLADSTKLAIPGVFAGGSGSAKAFRSEKGLAPIEAIFKAGENPLVALMKPFRPMLSDAVTDPNWERAIGHSLQEFERYMASVGTRPNVMNNAYDQAIDLIKSDKYKVTEKWSSIYAKYQAAVAEAVNRDRIMQIFKQPIKADGSKPFRIDLVSNKDVNLQADDLRMMFGAGTGLSTLAESFALAEIVTTENLSPTLTVTLGNPVGYSVDDKGQKKVVGFGVTNDQHTIGSVVSVLSTTAYYRGIINCLHELVAGLKRADIFNDTVIHIGSEFSRTPILNGEGSDHGFAGSSSSIISGKIKQFGLIGNIHREGDPGTAYVGTWGRAANFPEASGKRPIWVQDIANTICAMLATRMVSENGVMLLNGSDNWKPFHAEAKNVA